MSEMQSSMRNQQQSIAHLQDVILQRVQVLEQQRRRTSEVSGIDVTASIASTASSLPAPASSVGSVSWSCPICKKSFAHRHSFKGHIRRLVKKSTRPKCFMNLRDTGHQMLVHRFEGSGFYEQSQAYCLRFHEFVCRAISKTRDELTSKQLVDTWLNAACAYDGRNFPECSYSSGSEHVFSTESSS